jgi:hypothetical protein
VIAYLPFSVTYAEPAISALAILGGFLGPEDAPYLYFLLSDWTQPLTLFVGIGVGLAAAVGVLRVRYGLTLRKVVSARKKKNNFYTLFHLFYSI